MRFGLRKSLLFAQAILLLQLSACLDTKPKTLSSGTIDFTATNTANSQSFRFSYAYASSNGGTKFVVMQGAENTSSAINTTCSSSGTSCSCVFMDGTGGVGNVLNSATTGIFYNSTTNQVYCLYSGINPTQIKLVNTFQQASSEVYTITNTLTKKQILVNLDANKVRSIYQYSCYYNFLEKWGTQYPLNFRCDNVTGPSGQAAACDAGTGANLCVLQSAAPFYLYGDNFSSNLSQKFADLLYDNLCGVQVKQYDCTNATIGNPTVQFGLFADQSGMFQTAIQMKAGPLSANQTFGYGASTITMPAAFGGGTMCPPGLTIMGSAQFTLNVAAIANILYDVNAKQGNNIPHDPSLTFTVAATPSTTTSFLMNRVKVSNCGVGGIGCSAFADINTAILNQTYTATGNTYCVFPSSIL